MENPILKAHLEGVEEYERVKPKFLIFDKQSGSRFLNDEAVISFLTTYAEMILKAAKEAGPEKRKKLFEERPKYISVSAERAWEDTLRTEGFNDCRLSFRSAIDEGIKQIKQ